MSRARGPSIVHAVADELAQAIEDITHDWSLNRNQQWITRTATIGVDPAIQTLQARQAWTRHTKPVADRLDRKIAAAERRVADLESQETFRQTWLAEHPELARRTSHLKRGLQRLDEPVRAAMLAASMDEPGPCAGGQPSA